MQKSRYKVIVDPEILEPLTEDERLTRKRAILRQYVEAAERLEANFLSESNAPTELPLPHTEEPHAKAEEKLQHPNKKQQINNSPTEFQQKKEVKIPSTQHPNKPTNGDGRRLGFISRLSVVAFNLLPLPKKQSVNSPKTEADDMKGEENAAAAAAIVTSSDRRSILKSASDSIIDKKPKAASIFSPLSPKRKNSVSLLRANSEEKIMESAAAADSNLLPLLSFIEQRDVRRRRRKSMPFKGGVRRGRFFTGKRSQQQQQRVQLSNAAAQFYRNEIDRRELHRAKRANAHGTPNLLQRLRHTLRPSRSFGSFSKEFPYLATLAAEDKEVKHKLKALDGLEDNTVFDKHHLKEGYGWLILNICLGITVLIIFIIVGWCIGLLITRLVIPLDLADSMIEIIRPFHITVMLDDTNNNDFFMGRQQLQHKLLNNIHRDFTENSSSHDRHDGETTSANSTRQNGSVHITFEMNLTITTFNPAVFPATLNKLQLGILGLIPTDDDSSDLKPSSTTCPHRYDKGITSNKSFWRYNNLNLKRDSDSAPFTIRNLNGQTTNRPEPANYYLNKRFRSVTLLNVSPYASYDNILIYSGLRTLPTFTLKIDHQFVLDKDVNSSRLHQIIVQCQRHNQLIVIPYVQNFSVLVWIYDSPALSTVFQAFTIPCDVLTNLLPF